MNDQKEKINSELREIEKEIISIKEKNKELRLRKYFLNQMIGKIDRLEKDFNSLIKSDEKDEK